MPWDNTGRLAAALDLGRHQAHTATASGNSICSPASGARSSSVDFLAVISERRRTRLAIHPIFSRGEPIVKEPGIVPTFSCSRAVRRLFSRLRHLPIDSVRRFGGF